MVYCGICGRRGRRSALTGEYVPGCSCGMYEYEGEYNHVSELNQCIDELENLPDEVQQLRDDVERLRRIIDAMIAEDYQDKMCRCCYTEADEDGNCGCRVCDIVSDYDTLKKERGWE